MNRTSVAAVLAVILLAGCTPTSQPSTVATAASDQPDPPTVQVKLVIKANVQTTVRYSNGDMTTTAEMAPDPSTGVSTAEFEAPVPWVVAATATSALSAPIECSLYVDGKLVDSSTPRASMFAMCAATQQLPPPEEGDDGAPMVIFRTGSKRDVWAGWATERYTDSRTGTNLAVGSNEHGGLARLVVVQRRYDDPVTCRITVSDEERATDSAIHGGDIATCVATVP